MASNNGIHETFPPNSAYNYNTPRSAIISSYRGASRSPTGFLTPSPTVIRMLPPMPPVISLDRSSPIHTNMALEQIPPFTHIVSHQVPYTYHNEFNNGAESQFHPFTAEYAGPHVNYNNLGSASQFRASTPAQQEQPLNTQYHQINDQPSNSLVPTETNPMASQLIVPEYLYNAPASCMELDGGQMNDGSPSDNSPTCLANRKSPTSIATDFATKLKASSSIPNDNLENKITSTTADFMNPAFPAAFTPSIPTICESTIPSKVLLDSGMENVCLSVGNQKGNTDRARKAAISADQSLAPEATRIALECEDMGRGTDYRFKCKCGYYFQRRYNLKVHARKHTEEKPYKCDFEGCDKAFKWRSSMSHHNTTHLKAPVKRGRKPGSSKKNKKSAKSKCFQNKTVNKKTVRQEINEVTAHSFPSSPVTVNTEADLNAVPQLFEIVSMEDSYNMKGDPTDMGGIIVNNDGYTTVNLELAPQGTPMDVYMP